MLQLLHFCVQQDNSLQLIITEEGRKNKEILNIKVHSHLESHHSVCCGFNLETQMDKSELLEGNLSKCAAKPEIHIIPRVSLS